MMRASGQERDIFDGVLVVGAGLAGLAAALSAAPRKALVVTPAPLAGVSASAWAQGGVAAALSPDDDPALHAADTIAAGAGLTDPAMADLLAHEGPDAVRWLAELGAPFDRDAAGGFSQGLEAAHSRPRVARVRGDGAGRAVMQAVAAAALAAPHVEVREGVRVRALLQDAQGRVRGVLAERQGRLMEVVAPAVVLATGGVGGLYAVTTNPTTAIGSGLALAAAAGACIGDPEFVQFHPTAMDLGRDPAPLATEALRGEGARLIDAKGRAFMAAYHAQAELAPRDIVARAIHRQLVQGAGAFLDARTAVGHEFPEVFPTVFAACMEAGLDPRIQPIPVAPAAHYHMGGIASDVVGASSLEGLYVAGECACTGVHGANRLASNSLLEATVFGRRAGAAASEQSAPSGRIEPAFPLPDLPAASLGQLRRAMSRDAGVMRDRAGLGRLIGEIEALKASAGPCPPLVAAELIAAAALARKESRGGHYRSDFPVMASPARRTLTTLATLSEIARRVAPAPAAA
jgi:L-aspartate oxidase